MEANANPLISVIIPVYNVEQYLGKCVDSVICQTYRRLEILIIDDGSTDGCGRICDEYAEKDERIKVFHTENRGLSAARNLGLDEATGEYISFIDSDDWFELKAIETAVDAVIESKADIACFRFVREYKNASRIVYGDVQTRIVLVGEGIITDYCTQPHIGVAAWNKLYKKGLFENIRFPEGRYYEEIATTHRVLLIAKKVVCIPNCLLHYRARKNSIARSHTLKSIQDQWKACIARYEDIVRISEGYGERLIESCLGSIGRMWSWYSGFSKEEKEEASCLLKAMQNFSCIHREEVLRSSTIPQIYKTICVCSTTTNPSMMRLYYISNRLRRRLLVRERLYE